MRMVRNGDRACGIRHRSNRPNADGPRGQNGRGEAGRCTRLGRLETGRRLLETGTDRAGRRIGFMATGQRRCSKRGMKLGHEACHGGDRALGPAGGSARGTDRAGVARAMKLGPKGTGPGGPWAQADRPELHGQGVARLDRDTRMLVKSGHPEGRAAQPGVPVTFGWAEAARRDGARFVASHGRVKAARGSGGPGGRSGVPSECGRVKAAL